MTGGVILPPDVKKIISRLNGAGHEAYAVGGCVRDSVMNKTPVDWDITTSALPREVKGLFGSTHDTGIAHGTVTVVLGAKNYEVTTFRVDGEYLDGRRPESVSFTASLREDLLRRDFTMNAIAWHDGEGFIDPFGGIADIGARLVRGVGDPGRRFREDALRMLRAVRFAARLDFDIEPETWRALAKNAPLIKSISMERVRDEFLKLLVSDRPERVALLAQSGLMRHIDPALAERLDAFDPALLMKTEPDPLLRFTMLLRGLSDERETKDRLKYFRLDNKAVSLITTLLSEIERPISADPAHIRRRLAKIKPGAFRELVKLSAACGGNISGVSAALDEILSRGDCIGMGTLAIGGDDLKKLGITEGREIGRALNALLEHVLDFPGDNTRGVLAGLAEGLAAPAGRG